MAIRSDIGTIEVPGRSGPERPREFIPTPERVSQYLELKTSEVMSQMKSIEGRKALFEKLLEQEDQIREDHDTFDATALRSQLELAGETLSANERYMQEVRSPEKKGMFSRAWDTVKQFPANHPVVTAVLGAAAFAGTIAAGYYGAANLESVMASVGLGHLYGEEGAAAAAEAMGTVVEGAQELPNYFEGPGGDQML